MLDEGKVSYSYSRFRKSICRTLRASASINSFCKCTGYATLSIFVSDDPITLTREKISVRNNTFGTYLCNSPCYPSQPFYSIIPSMRYKRSKVSSVSFFL